ncbi:hypothetical protein EMCRGX_G015601 [Ephydatia muelleri]
MPWTPSPQSQPSLTDEQACNVIRPLSLYTLSMEVTSNVLMPPHTPFPSMVPPLPRLSNGPGPSSIIALHQLPSPQLLSAPPSPASPPLAFSANDPLLAQIPSQRFEVSSSGQHPHKKSCPVQGCQQLIAPTTWADPPVPLPTFDSDCKLPGCTVQHIPVKDRLAFALALCSALRSALQDNSEDAWLKVFMLPKCLLLAPKHGGRHHKPVPIKSSMRPMVQRHPPPQLLTQPCLPPDFDIMALLHSFPKDTACGPSGLHIQHLIEASEVPLQFPICAVLRVVVNLLISGKVPVQVARFLAGDNLVALEKNKPNCPPDIRPIAVGEAIRHLAGKCLCVITKEKAHDFLAPLQLGVACPAVLKIDLHNAFNQISRQAVLDACGLHFPELLPTSMVLMVLRSASCLVAPFGYYSTEIGVQQGDPLDRGPPLGLYINITKCELFSSSELSTFPDEMKRSIVPHFEILGTPIVPTSSYTVDETCDPYAVFASIAMASPFIFLLVPTSCTVADTVLDPLGHHASTCKRGGDAVFRHNRHRDVVAKSCRLAHLSVKVEARNNLTPDHSHTRPADVLVQRQASSLRHLCDLIA